MTSDPFGGSSMSFDRSHLTELDLLVEQWDQELAHDGVVSPLTARQIEAYAKGEPIPHVDLNSPAIKEATARLLRNFRKYRELQANPHAAIHGDDEWNDDEWDDGEEEVSSGHPLTALDFRDKGDLMLNLHHFASAEHIAPGSHTPLYHSADGLVSSDPLALVGSPPRFSLKKLALHLSLPAMVSTYPPDSPWAGVSRFRAYGTFPAGKAPFQADELAQHFQHSIRRCIGDATTVAVAVSASLESTALLLHTGIICRKEGRRLIAVLIDVPDEMGQSNAAVMRHLIEDLHLHCDGFFMINGEKAAMQSPPDSEWNPHGPKASTWPQRVEMAMADLIATQGVQVLLTGSGADPLLAAPHSLLPHLLRKGRFFTACSYLRDQGAGGWKRVPAEILALIAPLLPAGTLPHLYRLVHWQTVRRCKASPVIAEPYRTVVEQWTAQWIASMQAYASGSNWAQSAAWDALFALDPLPECGMVKTSPFLDPVFVEYAMTLPLEDRYSPRFASAYQRSRALIMRLYPQGTHEKLPARSHTAALPSRQSEAVPLSERFRRCIAYGLIHEDALLQCQDTILLAQLEALDRWIAGAEEYGATASE